MDRNNTDQLLMMLLTFDKIATTFTGDDKMPWTNFYCVKLQIIYYVVMKQNLPVYIMCLPVQQPSQNAVYFLRSENFYR
jgi:hypothetical protein